jgi:hypothetical protein
MITEAIQVIQINATQKAWVENENANSDYKAQICDYIDTEEVEYNNCIDAVVLTAIGYESWASYFEGATVTDVEIETI